MNLFAEQPWMWRTDLWTWGRRSGWNEWREYQECICITICKTDSKWEFAVLLRELKLVLCWQSRGVGWGGRFKRKETYAYSWLIHVQFSSVAQSCPTLCNPMNRSMPGLPVHHQLPEFTHTHVYRVGDAIQPSHPLLSLCPPAPNSSQHQGLFQWVNSSHEVAKVLEFQLQFDVRQKLTWYFKETILQLKINKLKN